MHSPLPCRAQWTPTALLIRTSGIWSLRRSYWSVGVLPSGCCATPHADCRSHGSHVRHHPGHYEGDCVRGRGCPRTLQRSQYELGQRAHRGGDQLHHLRPYSDPPEEAASDGLYSPIVAIQRDRKRGKLDEEMPKHTLKRNKRSERVMRVFSFKEADTHTAAQVDE